MKIIKTASGKKTIKISKKEWESIGKKAGWIKKATIGGSVETTVYLGDDGLYSPHGESDEGVDVVIEYVYHKGEPQTYIDPGVEPYNEITSMVRIDDGTEIFNYNQEDFEDLMDQDYEGQLENYWETKGDLMREERDQ